MAERAVARWARRVWRRRPTAPARPAARPTAPVRPAARPTARPTASPAGPAYRGDFGGTPQVTYAPHANGVADPGEVVWAWVPYEEDATRGKDRPVLVLAVDGADLLGLMLTSKDHDRRHDADAWFDLGTGAWDRQGRPSEVRLDRVLRLAPSAVRREGATLDRARFDRVVAAMQERRGR
ncbi:type II toxin-antitoxin system PemK/MazF family toxin [Nocardioides dongxiaopingii]|uniref:type II toxin-antitoxin system PemK/MazF family toxin n=1 Tax=Nocardioides sp. S-1144 TaxID=2582905 RepID=UPI001651F327|nr:type II toxin-antitoxin system PemK/MazF family toxin [Nocardioides sp. S-1144]